MKSTIKQFKNGFTLAEVLITLVIVGVVAALTIPNIVYNSKKQEYSSRLKKFYSTMRQVEQKAMADGKSWVDWAETNNFTNGSSGEAITTSFINSCILPYMSYSKATSNTVYLNDGSYFSLRKGTCFDFTFDVNGGKKPNQTGSDQYLFLYCPQGATSWINQLTFIPYQTNTTSRSTLLSNCRTTSAYCSGLLMLDGWEYKSDYPYRL